MSEYATDLCDRGICHDVDGNTIKIHSQTSLHQAKYISNIIEEINAKNTIEIGLGFGVSSLFICEKVSKKNGNHTIIDAYQFDNVWRGAGIENLNRAGFEKTYTFYEDDACLVLPRLLDRGEKYDFAYVDASKRLDHLIIFFFFLFRMIKIGGVIAFDDIAWFPGCNDALRYIVQMPGVEVHSRHQLVPKSNSRNIAEIIARAMPIGRRIFAPEWVKPADSLGINAGCVAIRKIEDNIGDWNWHP